MEYGSKIKLIMSLFVTLSLRASSKTHDAREKNGIKPVHLHCAYFSNEFSVDVVVDVVAVVDFPILLCHSTD